MIIDIPKVGQVEFPDSMSEADINKAAKKLYDEANVEPKKEKGTMARTAEIVTRGMAQTVPGAVAGTTLNGSWTCKSSVSYTAQNMLFHVLL
jgi:hypothetical protein